MKSMYGRQFALMAGIVLVSFILFGGAFMALSYRFTVEEKQNSLERNAGFIADFTSAALSQGMTVENQFFQAYVASIALISDTSILLVETDGQVAYFSDGTVSATLPGSKVSSQTIQYVLQNGGYSGNTALSGLFSDVR